MDETLKSRVQQILIDVLAANEQEQRALERAKLSRAVEDFRRYDSAKAERYSAFDQAVSQILEMIKK